MTKDQLKEKILAIFPKAEIIDGPQYVTVNIPTGRLLSMCKELKESPDSCFDLLVCLSGVDYGTALGVTYHLGSSKHDTILVLKTSVANRETPQIDSVCSIWKAAEFHEREVYDFFGITFKDHPDMRRMFLDEDWVGYPLRKDYTDNINIIER